MGGTSSRRLADLLGGIAGDRRPRYAAWHRASVCSRPMAGFGGARLPAERPRGRRRLQPHDRAAGLCPTSRGRLGHRPPRRRHLDRPAGRPEPRGMGSRPRGRGDHRPRPCRAVGAWRSRRRSPPPWTTCPGSCPGTVPPRRPARPPCPHRRALQQAWPADHTGAGAGHRGCPARRHRRVPVGPAAWAAAAHRASDLSECADAAVSSGLRVLPVAVDAAAPEEWLDGVERALAEARPAAAYVMPDFQNPTGLLLDVPQRERLTRALRRAGTTAIVDETFVELGGHALTSRWPPCRPVTSALAA